MEIVKHETCLEYFRRRLREGWKCISLEGYNAVLLSSDGNILRPVDLRNDIETLRPNAAGDECNIESESCFACPNHYTCFVEEDGGAVHSTNTDPQRDLYNIQNHVVGRGTINHITLYFGIRGIAAGSRATGVIKSNGTITEDIERNPYDDFGNNTYGVYSKQWTTNPAPPGTDTWTWDDIDALQIGIKLQNLSSNLIQCSELYIEVDHPPLPSVPVTDGDLIGIAVIRKSSDYM